MEMIGRSASRRGGGCFNSRFCGKIQLVHTYNDIISLENLCLAWQEFVVGKKSKQDVQIFARDLMDNIVELHQSLVNQTYIYMNRFDQWVKHKLNAKYYTRYADDFVFLSHDKKWLESIIPKIQSFLNDELKLSLHPGKLFLKTIASGMDFLGWVTFPDHRILRATTKRRMLVRIKIHPTKETLQSYLGLLSHGNATKNTNDLLGEYWLWR